MMWQQAPKGRDYIAQSVSSGEIRAMILEPCKGDIMLLSACDNISTGLSRCCVALSELCGLRRILYPAFAHWAI